MKRFLLALVAACTLILGGAERSSEWPAVRAAYLKQHGECAACGTVADLEVHHVLPFANDPKLELDVANLIALCRDCHFMFGHFKNFRTHNPRVKAHAAVYRKWKAQYQTD